MSCAGLVVHDLLEPVSVGVGDHWVRGRLLDHSAVVFAGPFHWMPGYTYIRSRVKDMSHKGYPGHSVVSHGHIRRRRWISSLS